MGNFLTRETGVVRTKAAKIEKVDGEKRPELRHRRDFIPPRHADTPCSGNPRFSD